jgi:hypothetical protein
MSKANSGKGKAPEMTQKGGNDQGNKKTEARGQATSTGGAQRGGRGGGGAGRGGSQQPAAAQGQRGGGGRGGGSDQQQQGKGAVAKQPDYLSKYPRLELEKENKQLEDYTAKIDAAYGEMVRARPSECRYVAKFDFAHNGGQGLIFFWRSVAGVWCVGRDSSSHRRDPGGAQGHPEPGARVARQPIRALVGEEEAHRRACRPAHHARPAHQCS